VTIGNVPCHAYVLHRVQIATDAYGKFESLQLIPFLESLLKMAADFLQRPKVCEPAAEPGWPLPVRMPSKPHPGLSAGGHHRRTRSCRIGRGGACGTARADADEVGPR
jgi:hypothetical protein